MNKMIRFPVGMPNNLLKELDRYREPGTSRSALIRDAVRNYLKIRKENGGK